MAARAAAVAAGRCWAMSSDGRNSLWKSTRSACRRESPNEPSSEPEHEDVMQVHRDVMQGSGMRSRLAGG